MSRWTSTYMHSRHHHESEDHNKPVARKQQDLLPILSAPLDPKTISLKNEDHERLQSLCISRDIPVPSVARGDWLLACQSMLTSRCLTLPLCACELPEESASVKFSQEQEPSVFILLRVTSLFQWSLRAAIPVHAGLRHRQGDMTPIDPYYQHISNHMPSMPIEISLIDRKLSMNAMLSFLSRECYRSLTPPSDSSNSSPFPILLRTGLPASPALYVYTEPRAIIRRRLQACETLAEAARNVPSHRFQDRRVSPGLKSDRVLY